MAGKVKTKRYLTEIARETEHYFNDVYDRFNLKDPIGKTVYYEDMNKLPDVKERKEYDATKIEVKQMDTLDCAKQLVEGKFNPLVLNMASDYCPGGGWRKGASAQEEELCRRSTYALSLEQESIHNYYPLSNTACIYSPDVVVFRGGPDVDYEIYKWKDCLQMAFIALPALRRPKLVKEKLCSTDVGITIAKIQLLFETAIAHGHDSVVLSAMGCGVFQNPPAHIAKLFNAVIKRYKKYFKYIVFAILGDNYDVFKKIITI